MTPVTQSERLFSPEEWQRLQEEDKQALRAVIGILNGILVLALIGYTGVVLGILVSSVTGVVAAVSVGLASLFLVTIFVWAKRRPTITDSTPPFGQGLGTPARMKRFLYPERQPETSVHA